jgi:hypothetical protein
VGSGGAQEPPASRARGDGRELSGLRLLLAQLDDLLRDPTITLALKRLAARLSRGLHALGGGLRRLLALRLPRLPRWLLAVLLALLPALLVLAALLSSRDDDHRAAPAAQSQAAGAGDTGSGVRLPGVGMPALAAAQERPKPVRVALVLDRTYDPVALRRELRALGTWLQENHAAGTRVSIIDAQAARASAPLRPATLASGGRLRAQESTTAAVRTALGGPPERRLLVTLGSQAPRAAQARTLSIATRHGASGRVTRSGARSRVAIDERRPNALAATIARAIMRVSGQREPR